MLNIYICEHNIRQLQLYQDIIQKHLLMMDEYDYESIYTFADNNALLDKLKSNRGMGLFFLGMEKDSELDIILLAKEIRLLDPRGFIVLLTPQSDISQLIFQYKLEIMDFIPKNDDAIRERICSCIASSYERYMSNQKNHTGLLKVKSGRNYVFINMADILYIQTAPSHRRIEIHTMNNVQEFYTTLNEVAENLSDDFYRCHKNCIVNRKRIRQISNDNEVVMENGDVCHTSSRLKKGLLSDQ